MSWTKRQLIAAAFDELGLSLSNFDLQPEQLTAALIKLDAMMAMWNAKGIRVSYPLPSSPELSNINSETGLPDFAAEAVFLNLAIRLAPSYGKTVAADTKQSAKEAYAMMKSRATIIVEQDLNGSIPMGAGYKNPQRPMRPRTMPDVLAGQDGELILE